MYCRKVNLMTWMSESLHRHTTDVRYNHTTPLRNIEMFIRMMLRSNQQRQAGMFTHLFPSLDFYPRHSVPEQVYTNTSACVMLAAPA